MINFVIQTQNTFPPTTLKACLIAATGVMKMKWRVWREKLLLLLAIRKQEEGVLAWEMLDAQIALGLPGLAQECTHICLKIGLPDICRGRPDRVTREEISEHIFFNHLKSVKED